MTLTREWRRLAAVALVALAATAFMVWGNQRQAHAFDFFSIPISGGDIVDTVECILDANPPADVFDVPGCEEAGGQIDWCPNEDTNPGVQDMTDLPCTDGNIDHCPDLPGIPAVPGCDEEETPVDVCSNISGDQASVPEGYHLDGEMCIQDTQEEDDVCPNLDGAQASVPDGYHLNDEESECVADEDTGGDTSGGDEDTGGSSSGGHSHHGSGGSSNGLVLGAETCSEYLTGFIRMGQANDTEQVTRLQRVLKEFEGAPIEITGIYDAATLAAVNAFQLKYASEVLSPWAASQPTGFVYLTTRKKVNEVYCNNTIQFPLTPSEAKHLIDVRTKVQATQAATAVLGAGAQAPVLTAPPLEQEEGTNTNADGSTNTSSDRGTQLREVDGQPQRGFWGTIGSFFGGLFGR